MLRNSSDVVKQKIIQLTLPHRSWSIHLKISNFLFWKLALESFSFLFFLFLGHEKLGILLPYHASFIPTFLFLGIHSFLYDLEQYPNEKQSEICWLQSFYFFINFSMKYRENPISIHPVLLHFMFRVFHFPFISTQSSSKDIVQLPNYC